MAESAVVEPEVAEKRSSGEEEWQEGVWEDMVPENLVAWATPHLDKREPRPPKHTETSTEQAVPLEQPAVPDPRTEAPKSSSGESSNARQRRAARRLNQREVAKAEQAKPTGVPIKPSRRQAKKMTPAELADFDQRHNPRPEPVLVAPEDIRKTVVDVSKGGQEFAYKQKVPGRTGKRRDWVPEAGFRSNLAREREEDPRAAAYRAKWRKRDGQPPTQGRGEAKPRVPVRCPNCHTGAICLAYPTDRLAGVVSCYRCFQDSTWGKPTGPKQLTEKVTQAEGPASPETEQKPAGSPAGVRKVKSDGELSSSRSTRSSRRSAARKARSEGSLSGTDSDSSSSGSTLTKTQRRNRRRRAQRLRAVRSTGSVAETTATMPSECLRGECETMEAVSSGSGGLSDEEPEVARLDLLQKNKEYWEKAEEEAIHRLEEYMAERPADALVPQNKTFAALRRAREKAAGEIQLAVAELNQLRQARREGMPSVEKPQRNENIARDTTLVSDGKPPDGYMYTMRVGPALNTGVKVLGKRIKGPFGYKRREELRKNNEILDSELYYYLQSEMFGVNPTASQIQPLQRKAKAWLKEHRPKLSEEERFFTLATAVTEAMIPHPASEHLRQRLKEDDNNAAIHKKSQMLKGDLGRAGILLERKVLPSVEKETG